MNNLRVFCAALALATVPASMAASQTPKPAENTIVITPRLVTSAQPSRAFLETLHDQGFDVLVYLAPPTVDDAIADEPLIVGRQGLVYVNIPVAWAAPTRQDFESLSAVLDANKDRKVYVHCQANFRTSSLVFLYRVIRLKEDPNKAWDAVRGAWEPNPTWRAFILATLKAYKVDFDPM
jgi:protein tyrosine phosphatase (PTP) superfamily phosphohydrolase (DUF442 family)